MVKPRERLSWGLQNPKSNYNAVPKLSLQKGFQLNTGSSILFSYCSRDRRKLSREARVRLANNYTLFIASLLQVLQILSAVIALRCYVLPKANQAHTNSSPTTAWGFCLICWLHKSSESLSQEA